MKLNDIIKTKAELEALGYGIENEIILGADIDVVGHFGNKCALDIWCKRIRMFGGYNNQSNLGFLLKAFVELFELTEEDGFLFSKIKDIPCRIVYTDGGGWGSECIGFGHFMEDRFVLREDFAKINEC